MRGGDDIRPGPVDLRVDREGPLVDVVTALDDLALVVDEDQVATVMCLNDIPNGFTQKQSVNSGSRAVM